MCPSSTSNSDPHADEGLIFDPPSSEPTRGRQLLALFVGALFLVTLVGTLILDTVAPLPDPKLTGGERIVHERLKAAAKISDGSFARLLERDLQLTSIVRGTVTKPYSYLLYRYVGLVRPTVLAGDEGWLYHKRRALALDVVEGTPIVAACSLAAMERVFAAQGTKVVSICVPRKAVVHPEHLPRGARTRPELDTELAEQLKAHGVTGPDLLSLFSEKLSELADRDRIRSALYGVADSHWTPQAQLITARAATRAGGLCVPKPNRLGTLQTRKDFRVGRDMAVYGGIGLTDRMIDFLQSRCAEDRVIIADDGAPLAKLSVGPEARIAVCGTSFTAHRRLPRLLAHFVGEPIHSAAQPAKLPTNLLHKFLAAGHRPEVLFMEYPNHMLFGRTPLVAMGSVYGELEFGPLPVMVPSSRLLDSPNDEGKEFVSKRYLSPVKVKVQHIVHSGDGVLAWRVSGEAFGEGVTSRAGLHPVYIDTHWESGEKELLLPVVSACPQVGVASFHVKSRSGPDGLGKLRIDSIELVLLASQESPIECEAAGTGRTDESWFLEFGVSGAQEVPKHAVLTMKLVTGSTSPRDLTIEVECEETSAPRLKFQMNGVLDGSEVYFNLNAHAGQQIKSIRVKGSAESKPIEVEGLRILRSGFD